MIILITRNQFSFYPTNVTNNCKSNMDFYLSYLVLSRLAIILSLFSRVCNVLVKSKCTKEWIYIYFQLILHIYQFFYSNLISRNCLKGSRWMNEIIFHQIHISLIKLCYAIVHPVSAWFDQLTFTLVLENIHLIILSFLLQQLLMEPMDPNL